MKNNEYLDLIDELNELIADNKFFENLGTTFSYTTNGYAHQITFGSYCLYNSENDSLSKYLVETGEYVDISLKELIMKQLEEYSNELVKISSELNKTILRDGITTFKFRK